MVNHYATLLLNESGENVNSLNKSYFIFKNYTSLILPSPLRRVHDILFPKDTSFYYRQFLCYNYLRIIDAAKNYAVFENLDPRITYDLDKLEEYFRVARISAPLASNASFNLLVFGTPINAYKKNYYYDAYTVKQLGSTPEICIRRDLDNKYLNANKESLSFDSSFAIPLQLADGSTSQTKEITLAGTGLSFIVTGKLADFSLTKDKYWNFIVEAPLIFNFNEIYDSLKRQTAVVDAFFDYAEAQEDKEIYAMWVRHFNKVYAFSALLNTYVHKINKLWQTKAM
jgi:hypothetical protein